MRWPLFVIKWRNARRTPKPFTPGMTLAPGESAETLLPAPEELIEAIREGGKQTITQGDPIDDGNGKFHIDALLTVERRDGVKLQAKIRLEGESE